MSLSVDELRTLDGLLRQALDLPEGERERWLDSLPPEHSRLAPFLRTHLREAGEGVETAEFPAALPRLPSYGASGDAVAQPRSGERVGPYELVRQVGEGGMGTVWLAQRADGAFRREVALKLPHRHLLDRGLAERMARERDILAALNDDRIARLYEAGVDAAGVPYLALEFVAGTPIDAYCASGTADLRARVSLMAQVARAVAHAHANLVVHRDLKPGNILVTSTGAAPTVKLLDFGVAKMLASDGQAGEGHDLTRVLGQALTPDYASPEQVLDQPLTTATDIYSLGVVLYQVACGEKPYTLRRQSAHALAEAIANADVARPSRKAAARGRADDARRIRGDLDAIILKALKPRPEDRYATASAFADDLERYLAGQPVLAQPDSLAYRAQRFVRRNAVAVTAGAAVSVALVVGAGVAAWQARQARIEAAKTAAVKDFLVNLFKAGGVGQENAAIRRRQPIGDVLMQAAKNLPDSLDAQPEVKSELQQTLGDLLEEMLLSEAAAGIRERRLRDLEARGAPLRQRMQAKTELAHSLGGTREKRRALAMLDEVIASLGGAGDAPSREVLRWAFTSRAMLRNTVAGGQGALEDAQQAVRLAEQDDPGGSAHVYTLIALGAANAANGNPAGAEVAYARALPLAAKLKGAEAAVEGTVQSHLARLYFQDRQYTRAEEHALKALAVIERFSGNDSFAWARNAIYPGIVQTMRGELPRAIGYLERAAAIFAGFGADIDAEFASAARGFVARALVAHGRPAEALPVAEAALAPYAGARREGAPPIPEIRARAVLGEVLIALKACARARSVLTEAVSLADRQGVPPVPNLEQARQMLAMSLACQGEHEKALAMLAGIIARDANPGPRFGAPSHLARLALAEVLLDAGRTDEAAREIERIESLVAKLAADERETARAALAQLAGLQSALQRKRATAERAPVKPSR